MAKNPVAISNPRMSTTDRRERCRAFQPGTSGHLDQFQFGDGRHKLPARSLNS
jgi:hypothetical protein